jgi:sigma-B regulation protein RsbU (phosphoserine phosphatase)
MSTSSHSRFRLTLAFKLGLLVLASTGLIFALAFGYSNHIARALVLKGVEANTRNLAHGTANRIEAVLHAVEPLPQWLARQVAAERPNEQEIVRLLDNELLASPHLYGGGVVFAPGEPASKSKPAAPYVYRKEGRLQFVNLADASYDYGSHDWYLLPRELGKAVWTDPYFDEGGGETMMCTYCVPFYSHAGGQDVFAGVVGADLELQHLVEIVSSIKLYQRGYAFLLSQNGQFVSHPNKDYVFKESIFSLADETGDKQWREIGRKMVQGGEGFVRVRSPNTRFASWLYYVPISSGWSVGILFPEADILADLRAMNRVVFWIGFIGFGLLLAVITLLSTGVTRPIRTLAQQTHEIARGNLDLAVPPVTSRDEVGDLSQSFENMRLALKEYVANLAVTTAAKERIESELKIAQTIQRSFLPKRFPPFPDRTDFEIFAELQPAKEVGGDLYDFFLLDEHRLFFLVGDVSGKGVPAALFMAVTKTLMKGVAEQHLSPSQVLMKVNHELYVDNDQMMFVTLFCGALDLRTGELQYTNAGHLPPLRLGAPGQAAWIDLPKGTVLGISDAPAYTTLTLRLQPMDTLLLYTDGVNEAMNPDKQLFGDDRLLAFARTQAGTAPKELVEGLFASVRGFAAGEEQSDDITVLALRYRGTS